MAEECPALVNRKDAHGLVPIFYALDAGKEMFKFLLSKGARLDYTSPQNKTVLHYAIEQGKDQIADFFNGLCEVDPSFQWLLEARDADGNVPLHSAAHMGKTLIVGLLLRKGCSINVRNFIGNTPYTLLLVKETLK